MATSLAARAAQKRVELAVAELERIEAIGEDIYENGAVLVFEKTFGLADDRAFTYAALRAGGRWWLTGTRESGKDWLALWDFIGPEADVFEVSVMDQIQ